MNVCVIPARGGSKRIPGKNIRPFHGRPILHYAIEAARASKLFDQIVVSTDSEEVATSAHMAGLAHVIKRPPELADDHATTAAVMKHAMQELGLEKHAEELLQAQARLAGTALAAAFQSIPLPEGALEPLKHPADARVCCLYPCTPFVTPKDLAAGAELLRITGKCYVMPVTELSSQRALRLDDGCVHPVWPQFNDVRTQDLEVRYRDAGQWYWGWSESWLKGIPIYYPTTLAMRIPRTRAIDIDDEEDWAIAEALYLRHKPEGHP